MEFNSTKTLLMLSQDDLNRALAAVWTDEGHVIMSQ